MSSAPTDELLAVLQVAHEIFAPNDPFEELSVIRLLRQWEQRHTPKEQHQALHTVTIKQWKSLPTPYSFWAVEKKQQSPKSIIASIDDLWPNNHCLHEGCSAQMVLTRLNELLGRNDMPKLRSLVRDVPESILQEVVTTPELLPQLSEIVRAIMSSHSATIRVLVLEWPLSLIKECAPDLAIVHALKGAANPDKFPEAIALIASHPPSVVLQSSVCLQELRYYLRQHGGWTAFDPLRQELLKHCWDEEQVADIAPLPDELLAPLISGRLSQKSNEPFFDYWRTHHPNRLRRALKEMSSHIPLSEPEMEGYCWMWSVMQKWWPQRKIDRCASAPWEESSVMTAVQHICNHPEVLARHIDLSWHQIASVLPKPVLGTIKAIEQMCNPNAPERPSLPVLCPDPSVLTKTPLQWGVIDPRPGVNQQAFEMCQKLAAHCARLNLEHHTPVNVPAQVRARKM